MKMKESALRSALSVLTRSGKGKLTNNNFKLRFFEVTSCICSLLGVSLPDLLRLHNISG